MLLSGAGGFAGHHFLEHVLSVTDWDVVATDSFRHRGTCDRIAQVLSGELRGDEASVSRYLSWRDRVTVLTQDLTAPFSPQAAHVIAGAGGLDYLIAMASESHVDRSITDPVPFVQNNTAVILNTLELARVLQPRAVVVISTDEVYGPETSGMPHPEWDVILPSNPYSASKAAQEAVAISYWRTYGVPVIITNTMNLCSERQSPEKYVPKLIRAISRGDEVIVHGTPGDIGTRHWLHCRNMADGVLFLLRETRPAMFPAHARPGQVTADRPDRYNIVGPDRISNLELAQMVAAVIGKPLRYRLEDAHSTRPGHDLHYGLDGSKMAGLGWKPPVPFAESLERTIRWTLRHPEWMLPD
jgi:dTDP-glucose 4,6-dehydratase